jgi:hypothetical protein
MSIAPNALPPPRAFDPDNIITLLVGPEEQRMTVHEAFLGQDSQFFQAALKEEWIGSEGQSREIHLPEESSIHMAYYIEHMYGLAPPTRVFTLKSQCPSAMGPQFELLAELYVLGERRLDPEYQNKIMHELFRMVQVSDTAPGIECANALFRGTTTESPARRMIVDYAATCLSDYWLVVDREGSDRDFWLDLSRVLIKKVKAAKGQKPNPRLKAADYLVDQNA